MTLDWISENIFFVWYAVVYCILVLGCLKDNDEGILSKIAMIVLFLPIAAIGIAFVVGLILVAAFWFLLFIYESGKVGSFILVIICVVILGIIEFVISEYLKERFSTLERSAIMNTVFTLANTAIAVFIIVILGLIYKEPLIVSLLEEPLTIFQRILSSFAAIFLAFATWCLAFLCGDWEEERGVWS